MISFYLAVLDTEEERQTFTDIYEKLREACFYTALKVTANHTMAEDAVHNAFMSLIKHRDEYLQLPPSKLKSRILIITKNKAIDLLRGEKYRSSTPIEELTDESLADSFDITEYVTNEESYQRLVNYVSKLPEQYRLVFQLRYIYDLSNKEIAEQLGQSQNVIATQIHRAKKILKEMLIKGSDFIE